MGGGREQGWEQREESPGLPLQVLEGEDSAPCPCWSLPSHVLCPCPSLMVSALGQSGHGWHLGHEALQAGGTNPFRKGTEAPPPPEGSVRSLLPWQQDLCSLWGCRVGTTAHFWGSSMVGVKLLPKDAGGKGEKKPPTSLWKLLSFLFSFQNSVINRNKLLSAVNFEGLCAKLELCWEQLMITQTGSERG